ncbi:MAG: DNA polymerase III subunit chi [Betaproteobacteria bacterium]|nr:DNA polymerase III subunit chi [Betaproteobacteria bacterium]
MTEIRIYENVARADRFIWRLLCSKILPAGQRSVVLLPSARRVNDLDGYLWSCDKESFIPHCLATHDLAAETPVLLAQTGDREPEAVEVLINCCDEMPANFAAYQSLVEIVAPADSAREAARQRVAEYESRGHRLQRFDMGAAAAAAH